MRRAAGLAAAALVALALPGVAAAHATLLSATPGTQSEVSTPPTEVLLRFDQAVHSFGRSILVYRPDGVVVSGTARSVGDGHVVAVPVSGLRGGRAYTVRWRVTSADGHSPAGVFTFGVGVKAPPPTEAVGAGAITWKDDAARWGLFAALALVIGPLVVRLVVLRGPVPPPLEKRINVVTTVAAFAAIDIGIAGFVLQASNALQLPIGDLLYGDLQPFAEQTRFGQAFLVMTFGFGIVAALLMVSWVFDRAEPKWAALLLSLALLSGLSLSSHQATEPNSSKLTELADWLHLVAACVWVGGVVTLAFCVWPAAPSLRRRAFVGFSKIAVALVGVMVLAGAYLAYVRLPQVSDLWTTSYGHLLLFKAALVGIALGWGGFHHSFVRPRLEAGEDPPVRPSLVGESMVAIAVLLAVALLVNAAPPQITPTSSSTAASSAPHR
jgi:copper transport protein